MSIMNDPIRMCIVCRSRFSQSELVRLQVKNGELCAFSKQGRSFYLCMSCIDGNEKRLMKALNQKCKTNHKHIIDYGKTLKEIATNG